MFAIAFDLVVADAIKHHEKGVSQAYADIGSTLAGFGFTRVQGSLYTNASEDLANLFAAMTALKAMSWLPSSVRATYALSVSSNGQTLRRPSKDKVL